MAKRLYASFDTPPVSPPFHASWEATSNAVRRVLTDSKEDLGFALESLAASTTLNSPAGAVDCLIVQLVSAPLSGNQNITAAIKAIFRAMSSSATGDLRSQCVIRVTDNAGTTDRGVLIASNAGALSAEWATTLTDRKFPLGWTGSGEDPTDVSALDDDRVVVELGFRKHENATTNRTGTISSGNPAGTDLPEDETGTAAGIPWIEFADTLVFKASAGRVSQEYVEAAAEVPSAGKVSQEYVEAAFETSGTSPVVSQEYVEAAVEAPPGRALVGQFYVEVAIEPVAGGGGETVQVIWIS